MEAHDPTEDFSNFTEEERAWIAACEVKILNHTAYVKYRRMQRAIGKIANVKLPGVEYTIKSVKESQMLSDIIDLPEELQDKIEARFRIYCKNWSQLQNLSKTAFGTSHNGNEKHSKRSKVETLLSTRKMDLVEMFSRMFPIKEVLLHVREEWAGGRDINLNDLKEFYNNSIELINRGIEAHKTDWTNLRLVAKKSRIEELTWTANILRGKINKNQNRDDIKLHAQLLDQVRRECEGEKLIIEGNVNLNVQGDINVHIRNNVIGNIPLREIIIARVAAKNQCSPLLILSDLNASYYAKINTLINGGEFVDFQEIGNFPSQQPYDFEYIRRVNDQADRERAGLVGQLTVVNDARQMKGDPIKERLLQILSQNAQLVHNKQIED